MAQTVRRTLALEAKLAEGVKARREKLITDGAERRATRAVAHKDNVDEAIMEGLHDAYAADCSEDEYQTLAERLLDDAREYLGDADEMRGYLDRPVGETVAKLCAAMGLDPEACEPDGETWRIRRPPLDFELRIEERARKYGASSSSLPRSGEGQDAKHPGWGVSPRPRVPVITPHSPSLDATHPVLPHEGRQEESSLHHASTKRRFGACRVLHVFSPCAIQCRVSAGSMTASISSMAATLIALPTA